jgi:sugar lactone lactonase YvrE
LYYNYLSTPLKPQHIKQLFYTALLLFSITYMFPACKGEYLSPTNIQPISDSTGSGTTIATVDTLPSFNAPSGLAVDASGNIYVADWGNNVIREITPAGVVSTYAGTGFTGYTNGAASLASFNEPTGLSIDPSGNLFVADAGNDLVRKIASTGMVSTIAGSDTSGYRDSVGSGSAFFDPLAVAVDPSDNVYVADAGNNLVRLVSSAGNVTTFAGTYNTGNSTTLSPFNNPSGIARDALGNLFVANYLNSNILEVNPQGVVSVYAGQTDSIGAVNGPASAATFYYPNSVAVDANDNVYVSDGLNNLIRKISPQGIVSTFAGSGSPGAVDSTGTAASFNGPAGLAFDAAGNLYVADANNNKIRKITPAGVVTTVAGSGAQGMHNGIVAARRTGNRKLLVTASRARFNVITGRKPAVIDNLGRIFLHRKKSKKRG